jgi:replicative DNA helicase
MNEITVPPIPFSRKNEEATLGSVLINPEALPVLRGIINQSDDFHIIRNKWVWEALCALDDKKEPVDILTVSDKLGAHLADVGGTAFITSLIGQSPSSLNAEHYAKQVHLYGVRRRMIQAANQVVQLSYNEELEVEDVVSRSVATMQQAANGLFAGVAQDAKSLVSSHYDMVDERSKHTELPGIKTGFFDLDVFLGGGLQSGDLTVAAGFPGIGKTAFLDTIASHVSKIHHVGLFSIEMSNMLQVNRMLAQETGINSQRLWAGKLTELEWSIYTRFIEEFETRKIKIDDAGSLSMATLRARCVQWKAQKQLDLIIVDYAGLLAGIGKTEYEVFSYLSKNLKWLARETGCHVLAAHQLNRKGREYEKPSIFHLRGSGTWEQDADNVFLIYEPKDFTTNDYLPRNVEIAKQRNGPMGTVELQMKKTTTKFENISKINFTEEK